MGGSSSNQEGFDGKGNGMGCPLRLCAVCGIGFREGRRSVVWRPEAEAEGDNEKRAEVGGRGSERWTGQSGEWRVDKVDS